MRYSTDIASRGRPTTKGKKMTSMITAKVLPEELALLKRAAALDREDGSLSRWLVELGLRRAKRLGLDLQVSSDD